METIRLRDLDIGDSARIVGFEPTHRSYRSKLLSMGLTKNTLITVRNVAPLGDPIHISVRDFDLSLRRDEADALLLVPVEGPGHGHGGRRHGLGRRRRRGPRSKGGRGRAFGRMNEAWHG